MTLNIDPEFQSLLPPLAAEDRAKLEANIIADGCTDPITLWQGLIVDGHNRYEICTRLKLGFQTIHITTDQYPDRDAVMLWMLSRQEGRRNLADIDRIDIARKKEFIIARRAKENLAAAGGDKKSDDAKSPLAVSPKAITPVNTRLESAKSANVGEKRYDAGKAILAAVDSGEIKPEAVERIRSGEASIHGVFNELKESRREAMDRESGDNGKRITYTPAIGMEIAEKVTVMLRRVADNDKEFGPALNAVVEYCTKRLALKEEKKNKQ